MLWGRHRDGTPFFIVAELRAILATYPPPLDRQRLAEWKADNLAGVLGLLTASDDVVFSSGQQFRVQAAAR